MAGRRSEGSRGPARSTCARLRARGDNSMSVEDKVRELIGRASGLPAADIRPEAKLTDLEMESLEKLECVLSLEDALKVEIKEEDLWRLKTVQDVIEAFQRVTPSHTCSMTSFFSAEREQFRLRSR